jgi:hypothetical protein
MDLPRVATKRRIRTHSSECWKWHPECHVEVLKEALAEAKKGLGAIADLWDAPDHRRRETPTMAESTLNRIKELTEEGK